MAWVESVQEIRREPRPGFAKGGEGGVDQPIHESICA